MRGSAEAVVSGPLLVHSVRTALRLGVSDPYHMQTITFRTFGDVVCIQMRLCKVLLMLKKMRGTPMEGKCS